MRSTLIFLLCPLLLFTAVGSLTIKIYAEMSNFGEAWDISKNDGEDFVTAKLYSKGDSCYELIISGNGKMADYSYRVPPPWSDAYSEYITSVIIEEGVSYIGNYAFYNLEALESVTIRGTDFTIYSNGDTVIPLQAEIRAHLGISVIDLYSAVYSKKIVGICSFADSVCDSCGYECINHTGGTAGCDVFAKCEICNAPYGSLAEHTYTEWHPGVAADCENDGIRGYYGCSGCDGIFDENFIKLETNVISSPGHNLGEWIEYQAPECEEMGILGHYYCDACESNFDRDLNVLDTVIITKLGHIGGIATCTNAAVCDVCQSSYGNKNPQNHTYSDIAKFDECEHWFECVCGDRKNVQEHTFFEEVIKASTEEEEGILIKSCCCGYEITELIEKLPVQNTPNTLDVTNEEDTMATWDETEESNENKEGDEEKPTDALLVTVTTVILIVLSVAVILIIKKTLTKR